MKFLRKLVLSAFFISTLSLVGTSANAACKARLGDFDWSSANIHTAISSFILEHGYGCEVSVTKGSTTPIMAAHYDKQLDVITEVWYDNIIANYEPHEKAGTIMNIGVNTPDSQQAFYVDKATADKYNLKSVEDMKDPKIAALFKDPEDPSKGRMTSCISGWTCYTVNYVKQREYDLDKYYTNFDPGSGGALDAEIAGAFAKKQPIFTYYWAPTGLMGKVDLVRLKEPAYEAGCWAAMSQVVEAIKLQRTFNARATARSLTVGDAVEFTGRGGRTVVGTVEKINRKTVIVNSPTQGKWKVTASMLKQIA